MLHWIRVVTVFSFAMCIVSYLYYNYNGLFAHIFVKYGVLSIVFLGLLLALFSAAVTLAAGFPLFKRTKVIDPIEQQSPAKIESKGLLLGLLTGLLICVPAIAVFIWVYFLIK